MKKIIKRSLFAMIAVLMIMGGFSVEALADDKENVKETRTLTPQGNMTLTDRIKGNEAEDKEFIVVQSRGGNYFYIIIDHAAEGENSVHFLNQVDEQDLLSIIDEKAAEEIAAVCICNDKCILGDVNANCPVCKNDMTKCGGKERIVNAETEAEPNEAQVKKNTGAAAAAVIIVLLGIGALVYLKFVKPKQSVKGTTDVEDLEEYEEYENEDEVEVEDK